ncbi:MAG: hypothetical protein F7B11_05765 [Caldisphaeraceae archaeon]|nr:hypothetical protein [Caldisphaeraceae archaeon]
MKSLSELLGSVIILTITIASLATVYTFTQNNLGYASNYYSYIIKRVEEKYNRPEISLYINNTKLYMMLLSKNPINVSYLVINVEGKTIIKKIGKIIQGKGTLEVLKNYHCENLTLFIVTNDGTIYQYLPYLDPNINEGTALYGKNYFSCKFLEQNHHYIGLGNNLTFNGYFFLSGDATHALYKEIKKKLEIDLRINGSVGNGFEVSFNVYNKTITTASNGFKKIYEFYLNGTEIVLYGIATYMKPYFLLGIYLYSPNVSYYNLTSTVKGEIKFKANYLSMPIYFGNAPIIVSWSFNSEYSGSFTYRLTSINGANNEATYYGSGTVSSKTLTPNLLLLYYSNIVSKQEFGINATITLNSLFIKAYRATYQELPFSGILHYNLVIPKEKMSKIEELISNLTLSKEEYPKLLFETPFGNVTRNVTLSKMTFESEYSKLYLITYPHLLLYSSTFPGFVLKEKNGSEYYLLLKEKEVSPFIINKIYFINISSNRDYIYMVPNNQFVEKIYGNGVKINQAHIYRLIDGINYTTNCKINIFYNINSDFLFQRPKVFKKNFILNLQNGLYLYQCYSNLTRNTLSIAYVS